LLRSAACEPIGDALAGFRKHRLHIAHAQTAASTLAMIAGLGDYSARDL
jgi:uncharacterized FlgJ-related protein